VSVAAILLAAGRSTRFGDADKLAAPLGDLPLGLHAARALAALPLAARLVVTGPTALEWPNFRTVRNERPEAGMAHSIGLGIAAARRLGADAVLIALADMPFVTTRHFQRLLDRHVGPDSLVASSAGDRRMPPALFGANWFDTLGTLGGDRGARALLDRADIIAAGSGQMRDVDSISDLENARISLGVSPVVERP